MKPLLLTFFHLMIIQSESLINMEFPTESSYHINHNGDFLFHENRFIDQLKSSIEERLPQSLPMHLPLNDLQQHGTTTVAFKFNGGLVVAVDSRASMGEFIGSRTTKKMFPISTDPPIVATMAGGAADCLYWLRFAATVAAIEKYKTGISISVKYIAKLLSKYLIEKLRFGMYYKD